MLICGYSFLPHHNTTTHPLKQSNRKLLAGQLARQELEAAASLVAALNGEEAKLGRIPTPTLTKLAHRLQLPPCKLKPQFPAWGVSQPMTYEETAWVGDGTMRVG